MDLALLGRHSRETQKWMPNQANGGLGTSCPACPDPSSPAGPSGLVRGHLSGSHSCVLGAFPGLPEQSGSAPCCPTTSCGLSQGTCPSSLICLIRPPFLRLSGMVAQEGKAHTCLLTATPLPGIPLGLRGKAWDLPGELRPLPAFCGEISHI